MGKNKYNIGDKVKTKIRFTNGEIIEVEEAIITQIINDILDNIIYKVCFEADENDIRLGCCTSRYVSQDDIIGLYQNSEIKIEVIRDRYNYLYDKCPHCNSELKIKKSGINYRYDNGYEVADIKCPCCDKVFRIKR